MRKEYFQQVTGFVDETEYVLREGFLGILEKHDVDFECIRDQVLKEIKRIPKKIYFSDHKRHVFKLLKKETHGISTEYLNKIFGTQQVKKFLNETVVVGKRLDYTNKIIKEYFTDMGIHKDLFFNCGTIKRLSLLIKDAIEIKLLENYQDLEELYLIVNSSVYYNEHYSEEQYLKCLNEFF